MIILELYYTSVSDFHTFIFLYGKIFLTIGMYYDLRLGLGCNLDKDLSKKVEISQLVKYKDTGLYL